MLRFTNTALHKYPSLQISLFTNICHPERSRRTCFSTARNSDSDLKGHDFSRAEEGRRKMGFSPCGIYTRDAYVWPCRLEALCAPPSFIITENSWIWGMRWPWKEPWQELHLRDLLYSYRKAKADCCFERLVSVSREFTNYELTPR
jgi:hypothetical protein